MLSNMVKILPGRIFGEFFTFRVNYPNLTIVEVDLVIFVHQTHIIGAVGISVTNYHIHIFFVVEDDIVKYLQR
ncbi:hypothetical protein ES703_107691 [subsurface metagenome]